MEIQHRTALDSICATSAQPDQQKKQSQGSFRHSAGCHPFAFVQPTPNHVLTSTANSQVLECLICFFFKKNKKTPYLILNVWGVGTWAAKMLHLDMPTVRAVALYSGPSAHDHALHARHVALLGGDFKVSVDDTGDH